MAVTTPVHVRTPCKESTDVARGNLFPKSSTLYKLDAELDKLSLCIANYEILSVLEVYVKLGKRKVDR